jgi:phage protein D
MMGSLHGKEVAPKLLVKVNGRLLSQAALTGLTWLRVEQRLALPTQCEMHFRAPPGPLQTAQELALGDKLWIGLEDASPALFVGDVTAVEHVYGPDNVRQILVRGYDALHRLRKRQQIRVFENVTLRELAQRLVGAVGLGVTLAHSTLAWERLYQYRQNDLELLSELAAQDGLYLTLRDEQVHLITLAGDGAPQKLELGRNLFEVTIEANADGAAERVVATGWDPALAQAHQGSAARERSGRRVKTRVAVDVMGGQGERYLVNAHAPDQKHVQALAQAALDQRKAGDVTLWGAAQGDPALQPGALIQVSGVAADLAGQYVITQATHTLETGGVSSYQTTLSTAPPELPRRDEADVTTYGVVSNIADPQGLGRVRAALPAYNDVETNWMAVVTPGAGSRKGFFMLPDRGDKVLVVLACGNPGQGIVVGGLYGLLKPPDDGIFLGQAGGAVGLAAVKRHTWLTPGGQRIQLNDVGNVIRLENDSGACIELSGGNVAIVGNRIDFRRISMTRQALGEIGAAAAGGRDQVTAWQEWLNKQGERNRALVILSMLLLFFLLVFIVYLLFSFFV